MIGGTSCQEQPLPHRGWAPSSLVLAAVVALASCGSGGGGSADIAAEGETASAIPSDVGVAETSSPEPGAAEPLDEPTVETSSPEPGSVAEQITQLAAEMATSRSGDRQCALLWSMLRSVYGFDCEAAFADIGRTLYATSARVTDIKPGPSSGTRQATVKQIGGPLDGAVGTWSFTKDADADGAWRVAEWSEEYLRSRTAAALGDKYAAADDDDPLGDADVRACAKARLASMDDFEFGKAAYDEWSFYDGGRAEAVLGCVRQQASGNIDRLRQAYQYLWAQGLRRAGHAEDQASCAAGKVERELSDTELRQATSKFGSIITFRKKHRTILDNCEG